GHIFQNNGLADDEENRDRAVGITVIELKLMQRVTEKMQNQEKIADHQHGIDGELNQECTQSLGRFFFHIPRLFAVRGTGGRFKSNKKSGSITWRQLSP